MFVFNETVVLGADDFRHNLTIRNIYFYVKKKTIKTTAADDLLEDYALFVFKLVPPHGPVKSSHAKDLKIIIKPCVTTRARAVVLSTSLGERQTDKMKNHFIYETGTRVTQ